MSDYKRLKENLNVMCMHNHGKGKVLTLTNGEKTENQVIDEIVSDCREILDKIEQGTLIKRPLIKKGDSIWIVCRYRQGSASVGSYYTRKVVRRCVDKIFLNNDNSFTISTILIEKGVKHRSIVKSNTVMKSWFLTREEAEKRLLELQGDKK